MVIKMLDCEGTVVAVEKNGICGGAYFPLQ